MPNGAFLIPFVNFKPSKTPKITQLKFSGGFFCFLNFISIRILFRFEFMIFIFIFNGTFLSSPFLSIMSLNDFLFL